MADQADGVPSIYAASEIAARASLAIAMRAIVAVVVLVAYSSRCCARDADETYSSRGRDTFFHNLISALGIASEHPIHKLITCSQSIGSSKCFAALSVWRAEKALGVLKQNTTSEFNLLDDMQSFDWKKYNKSTTDEFTSKLCESAEKLLQYRHLNLGVSGYELELSSKGNGTISIDLLRDQDSVSSRGMKKAKKVFYNIVPYLLLPGLIMSAILPFVLPALKLMTFAVGMLNNMALSGAVFTLLRNNAFNDKYEKKVIYVNEGYKNEEISYGNGGSHTNHVYEVHYDDKRNHQELEGYESQEPPPEYIEIVEESQVLNEKSNRKPQLIYRNNKLSRKNILK